MIIFNCGFVTLNEYIQAERSSKYKGAAIKKQQTNMCHFLALESKHKPLTEKVNIKFVWYKPNNKIDNDNVAFAKKFILDGLVEAGVLKNDSPKYVGNFRDEFIIDKTRDYISCAIHFE